MALVVVPKAGHAGCQHRGGRPQHLELEALLELVEAMGCDLTVVNSARVSFGKRKEELDEKDEKLIRYLIKHRHTSTLEHCVVTFRCKVPLFVLSQHHRHRTWSYNEISRRYTDFNIEFYEPQTFRKQHKSNRQASESVGGFNPPIIWMPTVGVGMSRSASKIIEVHHKRSLELFEVLLEGGVCREQARGVLPQNMYTEYYATANLNNIMKFIDLRTHSGAQWEIQRLAEEMLEICKKIYPITISCYNELKGGDA